MYIENPCARECVLTRLRPNSENGLARAHIILCAYVPGNAGPCARVCAGAGSYIHVCAWCARARVCVRVCASAHYVCACVRACGRPCVGASVCARTCAHVCARSVGAGRARCVARRVTRGPAGEVICVSIGRLPALPRVVCGRPDESRSPPRVFASTLVYRPVQNHVR